jgi:hypothetical protein
MYFQGESDNPVKETATQEIRTDDSSDDDDDDENSKEKKDKLTHTVDDEINEAEISDRLSKFLNIGDHPLENKSIIVEID